MSINTLRQRLSVPPPSEPRPTPQAVAPSLPPAPGETTRAPSPTRRDPYKLAKDAVIRKKAIAILALRAQGHTTDEIATELHIRPGSVRAYVYKASRAGLLKEGIFDDPHDRLEFESAHKVIRNLNAVLDEKPIVTSDGEIKQVSERMERVALRMAEGTLFKKFDQAKEAPQTMQMFNMRVEMPQGPVPQVAVDSMGGVGAYTEGETIEP